MYSLHYLAHLVQTKNDLNRKRRRFYALMNPGVDRFRLHASDDRVASGKAHKSYDGYFYYWQKKALHPAYSANECLHGYLNAQTEMKSMTKHMRAVCKELGAKLSWGSGGQISAIKHEGKTYKQHWAFDVTLNKHVKKSEITALANHYAADQILLERSE